MILINTAVFPPEQIVSANLSKDIAQELVNREMDVVVVSPKPSRPYGRKFDTVEPVNKGYEHQVLKSYVYPKSNFLGRLRESISFGIASRNYIRDNHDKITKIYANTWPLFAQFLIVKEAKKYRIPIALHVQDIYPESYIKKIKGPFGRILSILTMPLEKYTMRHASKIISISEDMKDYLVETRPLNEDNVYVVRNWQDDAFLTKEVIELKNTGLFTFMYAGSVSASAGVDLLIRAFGDLGAHSNCRLVIAGSGSDRDYCEKLAKGNAHIEFWDAPYMQIPEIQAKADVLLLSLKKGVGKTASPSKFTAYLFAKKPVLASIDENCDTANNIKSSKCGFVVPPENEVALRSMMEKVLTLQRQELEKLGQNGFLFAQKHLSRKVNLNKIVNILTE